MSNEEKKVDFVKKFVAAADSGNPLMVALWHVADRKIEMIERVTMNFPRGDFLAAVGQLANNLFEDSKQEGGLPSDPLPKATRDFPKPFEPRKPFESPEDDGDAAKPGPILFDEESKACPLDLLPGLRPPKIVEEPDKMSDDVAFEEIRKQKISDPLEKPYINPEDPK